MKLQMRKIKNKSHYFVNKTVEIPAVRSYIHLKFHIAWLAVAYEIAALNVG